VHFLSQEGNTDEADMCLAQTKRTSFLLSMQHHKRYASATAALQTQNMTFSFILQEVLLLLTRLFHS
jgi:hypothetical protein